MVVRRIPCAVSKNCILTGKWFTCKTDGICLIVNCKRSLREVVVDNRELKSYGFRELQGVALRYRDIYKFYRNANEVGNSRRLCRQFIERSENTRTHSVSFTFPKGMEYL